MPVKAWILRSARLQCPHCHKTVYMQYKGRWGIRKAFGKDSPTPESPLSKSLAQVAKDHLEGNADKYGCNDEPERDEGEERGDGA